MLNVIPGFLVIPPCKYSLTIPQSYNFGYTTFSFPNEFSRVKMEFLNYTHCREVLSASRKFFYNALSNGREFFNFDFDNRPFYYYPMLPLEIFAFVLDYIEKIIGVKTKAMIQQTDENGVLAIFPGKFWGGVAGRFGFFTCIIRAFCKEINKGYPKSGWENCVENWVFKSIISDKYLFETKDAVSEFMNGKTFIKNMKMTCDWHKCMAAGENLLDDPTKFSHEIYIGYVKEYAYNCWVQLGQPKGRDSEIWNIAERYAAINACR